MIEAHPVQQGQRYAQRVGTYTHTFVWEVGSVARDAVPIPHARLVDIQNQLASHEGTEALIDGFGAGSGRASPAF